MQVTQTNLVEVSGRNSTIHGESVTSLGGKEDTSEKLFYIVLVTPSISILLPASLLLVMPLLLVAMLLLLVAMPYIGLKE